MKQGEALKDLWQSRIGDWERSGLSQRAYCRQEGFGCSTFRHWRKQLREGLSGERIGLEDHFMPVTITSELPRLEVFLKSGHQVCFQGRWDWGEVSSLLPIVLKA